MTRRARGPNVLKGAFVTIAPSGGRPAVLAFRYNPATLRRSLKPQQVGGEEGDRSEAVRFTGAPVQTISVEIELDASDGLQAGDAAATVSGAMPELAALELLVYPAVAQVSQSRAQLDRGVMEVAPMTAPRTLFVWGDKRVLPVRITSYEIVEEIFDSRLSPIHATVTIAMRVLTYSDLDSGNRSYSDFGAYQQSLIGLAAQAGGLPASIGADLSGV